MARAAADRGMPGVGTEAEGLHAELRAIEEEVAKLLKCLQAGYYSGVARERKEVCLRVCNSSFSSLHNLV